MLYPCAMKHHVVFKKNVYCQFIGSEPNKLFVSNSLFTISIILS